MTAEEYFRPVAEEAFGDYLRSLGYVLTKSESLLLRFEKNDAFIELFALATDGPRYSPRVAIGPIPELGILTRQKQVDIMHALPEQSPLRRYNLDWRYTSPSEMKASFYRVRDEIFK